MRVKSHVDKCGGAGVIEMSTLFYNYYLIKAFIKEGRGVKNTPNFVYVVCKRAPLIANEGSLRQLKASYFPAKKCCKNGDLINFVCMAAFIC